VKANHYSNEVDKYFHLKAQNYTKIQRKVKIYVQIWKINSSYISSWMDYF